MQLNEKIEMYFYNLQLQKKKHVKERPKALYHLRQSRTAL